MSKSYKHAGLTPELYQLLVNERAALKEAHPRDYKQHFQKVRQCSEKQAIIILQALNNAVMERQRISPQKHIYPRITREVKPRAQFWIKPTQDCQRNCSNDSKRKWKDYARNTLTT